MDHVAPRSAFPRHNIISNVALRCQPCNSRKGCKIPSPWDFPLERLHPADRPMMAQIFRHYLAWWQMLGPVPREVLEVLDA